jgi:hypothetical protein
MYAAISEGGSGIPGEGKVTYYTAGPGCSTGLSNNARPDSLTGELGGFDAPAGLDEIFPFSPTGAFFALAESGSTKNQLVTLGMAPSTVSAVLLRIGLGWHGRRFVGGCMKGLQLTIVPYVRRLRIGVRAGSARPWQC